MAAGTDRAGAVSRQRSDRRRAEHPYFYQLKAQMLFESGRVAESIPAFQKAAALAPKGTDEIHTEYAQALLEREDKSVLPAAISELNVALKVEPRSADTHRFLAIAYGREGNEAMSKLELAEQAILEGRIKWVVIWPRMPCIC